VDPIQSALHLGLGAVTAVGLVALSGRFGGERGAAILPFAAAIAAAWQFGVQEGGLALRPDTKWALLPWTALAAAGAATVVGAMTTGRPSLERATLAGFGALVAITLVGDAPLLGSIQPLHVAAILSLTTALLLHGSADRWRGLPAAAWTLGIASAFLGVGVLSLLGSIAKLGIVAVSTAVAIAGLSLPLWFGRRSLGPASFVGLSALLAVLAGFGAAYFTGPFPFWLFLVPVVAPLAALAARVKAIERRPRLALAVIAFAPACIVAASVAIGGVMSMAEADEDGGSSIDSSVYGLR
jgi:hypothetical protein